MILYLTVKNSKKNVEFMACFFFFFFGQHQYQNVRTKGTHWAEVRNVEKKKSTLSLQAVKTLKLEEQEPRSQ